MGVFEMDISPDDGGVQKNEWFELKGREGKKYKDEVSGELRLAIRFSPKLDASEVKSAALTNAGSFGPIYALVQASDKMQATYKDDAVFGREFLASLKGYAGAIHSADDSSVLEKSILSLSHVIQNTLELRESLGRNAVSKLVRPLKESITARVHSPRERSEPAPSVNPMAGATFDSLVDYLKVYNSFFRVGLKSVHQQMENIMQYRTLIELHNAEVVEYKEGGTPVIPPRDIVIQGSVSWRRRKTWHSGWAIVVRGHVLIFKSSEKAGYGAAVSEAVPLVHVDVSLGDEMSVVVRPASDLKQKALCVLKLPSLWEQREWHELLDSCRSGGKHHSSLSLVHYQALSPAKAPESVVQFLGSDPAAKAWRDYENQRYLMVGWITTRSTMHDMIQYVLCRGDVPAQASSGTSSRCLRDLMASDSPRSPRATENESGGGGGGGGGMSLAASGPMMGMPMMYGAEYAEVKTIRQFGALAAGALSMHDIVLEGLSAEAMLEHLFLFITDPEGVAPAPVSASASSSASASAAASPSGTGENAAGAGEGEEKAKKVTNVFFTVS
eukprot:TRINITY_DN3106_c0_g1_i2.p1 TRINITY_DN3106_c0_g1~~TRINITY_DN3106_c0_g1_i2.p1  ORF type:complete len:556 (+),score=197.43 TRINITY_DN3106_c0_g1_i2:693-2360(+)